MRRLLEQPHLKKVTYVLVHKEILPELEAECFCIFEQD